MDPERGLLAKRWASFAKSAWLLACVALTACNDQLESPISGIFSDPITIRSEPSPIRDGSDKGQIYAYPDLVQDDGTTRRILWVQPGLSGHLNTLLSADPTWTAASPKVGPSGFFRDTNIGAGRDPGTTVGVQGWKEHAGLEPILFSGPKAAVEAATRLVQHVITSVPQIVIEARVVEVLESDQFAFGTEWYALNADDFPYNPTLPNAPLGRTDTIFDRSRIGRGIPFLPGTNSFVPNVLTELGTIQDDIQIDLLITALKAFTKVDVVNAPNVAVLCGHSATITAGTEVPTFEFNIVGASTIIATKFKRIGVSMDVLPNLIRPDLIRMAVQVKVENVTGGVTVNAGTASATNPIIASRTVTSTMDVRDGSTIILGGLISTGQSGAEDKVPVLGDVPLLDIFFKNRHRQETRSNLIFFIRPKIIMPGSRSSATLIVPPTEGELPSPPPEAPSDRSK